MSSSRGVGRGYRPMTRTHCVDCGHPMRSARKKLADAPGTRQHVGGGKCSRCYSVAARYPEADFTQMLIAQSGRCAACGDPMVGEREPAIDHCHETGRVRGLLCIRCNSAEGMLLGSPERAVALADYMKRNLEALANDQ